MPKNKFICTCMRVQEKKFDGLVESGIYLVLLLVIVEQCKESKEKCQNERL